MTESRWHRRPDVAWSGDEQRIVAARTSPPDPEGPRILEGAAARIWLTLDEPATAEALAARVASDVDPATVRGDIAQMLADLHGAGLVERT
jgi:hypothetical protein